MKLPPKNKRRSRSRGSSISISSSSGSSRRRQYKRPGSQPFKLRKSPLFGVVLRPKLPALGTIHEDEEYLDLEDLHLLSENLPKPKKNQQRSPIHRNCRQRKPNVESFSAEASAHIGCATGRPIHRGSAEKNNQDDEVSDEGGEKTSRRRKCKTSGIMVSLFGVRLKPTPRRSRNSNSHGHRHRIYQIDLNPAKSFEQPREDDLEDDNDNQQEDEYVSQAKAFLELNLRPLSQGGNMIDEKNDAIGTNDSDQKFVELQLRHVVAPADGGPRRAVTEAVFQIPLLKKVAPKKERSLWRKDRLQDLLQISVQRCKEAITTAASNDKGSDAPDSEAPHKLQIQLQHVDPDTQESQTLEHAIDVILNRPDIVEDKHVPSMQVTLRKVGFPPCTSRWSNAADGDSQPNLSSVQLKHITTLKEDEEDGDCSEHSLSESSGDIDLLGDTDFFSTNENGKEVTTSPALKEAFVNDLGKVPLTVSSEENHARPQNHMMMASMPDLALEQTLPLGPSDLNRVEEEDDENKDEEGEVELDVKKSDYAANRSARQIYKDNTEVPRHRSSSMTDIYRRRTKKKEENEKNKEKADLSNQKRRDLLMWYNRMRSPTKEEMKRKVLALDESCDITIEDVEGLPWLCRGKFLDLRVMNQMFLDDWQGSKKGDDD